jgi:uncharacterized protein YutE (UPF0331/DUF86 family)
MMPGAISKRVVSDRLEWIERMIGEIRALPLANLDSFLGDYRNIGTAESCLRRSLEALFDLGRHILAKGFGSGVSEYKEIALELKEQGVLSEADAGLLRELAGYRNQLVHFYHEVEPNELYEICVSQLADVERIALTCRDWLKGHPDYLDETL